MKMKKMKDIMKVNNMNNTILKQKLMIHLLPNQKLVLVKFGNISQKILILSKIKKQNVIFVVFHIYVLVVVHQIC